MSSMQLRDIVRAQNSTATEQAADDLIRWLNRVARGGTSKMYRASATIAASGSTSLDLAGGVTDTDGATLTFTKVRAILVHADRGNTNNVVVGGAGANTFVGPFADSSDKIAVQPGGVLLITCPTANGWTVTAGTGDILLIANSGGSTSVSYDIIIIGETA